MLSGWRQIIRLSTNGSLFKQPNCIISMRQQSRQFFVGLSVIACHLNTGQVRVSQPVSGIMQLSRKHSFPTTFQQVPDMSAIISVISVMNFQLQLLNSSVTLQLIHFQLFIFQLVNLNNITLIHRFYKFSSTLLH